MGKRTALYRGLSALMAFIMFISCTVTNLTFQYDSIINNALGISTTSKTESDEEDTETAIYYANDYGYDENALVEVYNDAAGVNVELAEEGIVLLKNEDDALPLATDSTRLTIFGNASVNSSLYSTSSPTYMSYVDFVSAMQDEFGSDNVNTTLVDNVYTGMTSSSTSEVSEAEISAVTEYEDTWTSDYNDVAVVVFGRTASEGNDLYMYSTTETYDDGTARRMLDLSVNEEALMDYLQEEKDAGVFDKIVVIITSEQQMELDFLYEYDVDAALMVGELGTFGCTGLAEILGGDVNPSGALVDTYAANSLSAPATTYAGVENTQKWTNYEEVNEAESSQLVNDNDGANIDYYIIYAEGIYVGYKYYETRYEDVIMGTGSADSTVGSSYDEAWDYADEIVYTLGYGLSYTTFDETIDSVEFDEENAVYDVTVTVTNTGSVAGKDIVEVYAQTPYGEYEQENLVEKASVDLVAYEKTDSIEPGESQTITIEVEEYFLASYDSYGYETYILSEGDYYLAIGDDAHDALNNILAAKGYTSADGMVDALGNAVDGDASKTYTWTQDEIDAETYSVSVYSDVEVTNLFDDADINYYGYDFTYLTRQDWEGTYPEEAVELEATDEVIADLSNYDYEIPEDAPSVDDFEQGVDNGLTLVDMMDVDLDDELWDDFVDQLTVEQMANLWTEGASIQTVAELDIPGTSHSDDDTNAGGGAFTWVSHPGSTRTWNKDMYSNRGTYQGLIASLNGVDEIWAGSGNLHRTPFAGRDRQYYSEDATLSYYAGYYEAQACQATGTILCVKHFATNDQETYRTGVSTFVMEQALREIYFRAFEGAFAGGALGTMTALNRIGTRLAKNNYALLTELLRGEWDYQGHVTSDGYVTLGYFQNTLEELEAGMDYSCIDSSGANAENIIEAVESGDGYALQLLRETAKRNLYVMAHTASMNGLGSGVSVVSIVPAWECALLAVDLVSLVLFVVFAIMSFVSGRKKKAPANDEDAPQEV